MAHAGSRKASFRSTSRHRPEYAPCVRSPNLLRMGMGLALAAVALAGCKKKSICDEAKIAPIAFPWDKHQDLVPPSAKVCGAHTATPAKLIASFPKDENPFVTIVQYLEGKGFERSHQDVKNLDLLFVTLERGSTVIDVAVHREKGYEPSADFTLHDEDCAGQATDGTSCRKGKGSERDQIIKCEHGSVVSEGATCDEGKKCFSNKNPRLGWTGDTAICVDR